MNLLNNGALLLLIVTTAISLMGLYLAPAIVERCLLRPYQVWRGKRIDTLWLSGFVHADLGHLLLNMLSFFFFAPALERYLGTRAFIIGYLLALVASSLPSLLRHRNDPNYATLGASGGVSAVIFAFILFEPTATLFILPIPIPIPAVLYGIAFVAYSLYAGRRGGDNINHSAHLWGALYGLAWVAVCQPEAIGALLRGDFG